MRVIAAAPAKVNLGLEILGRRPDGYHEIRTILQTVDLRDELMFDSAPELTLAVESPMPLGPDEENLILQAARLLRHFTGAEAGAAIHVRKRIPVAAGLGGGSSDAAGTLLGLNQLWNLDLSTTALTRLAADLGSDVPFFLKGGTCLASGRGETLEPLPPARLWVVLGLSAATVTDKTRRLYGALTPSDWTTGAAVAAIAAALASGDRLPSAPLPSGFHRVTLALFPALAVAFGQLASAGGMPALCGAGPTILSVHQSEVEARAVATAARGRGLEALVTQTTDEPARARIIADASPSRDIDNVEGTWDRPRR